MLSVEERIKLRDELFIKLYNTDIIVDYKENLKRLYRKKLLKYLQLNPIVKVKYNQYVSEFRSEVEAIYCLLHRDDINNHMCPICGKMCIFYNSKHGYRSNCEDKECVDKIRRKTNKELYGNENVMLLPEIQEKHKATTRKNHGCDYPTQDPNVVILGKQTKQERYGDPNYNNREQAEQTCMEKYNVKNPMQSEEIAQKFEDTMLQLHGVKHALQHPKFKELCRKRYFENRAVKDPIQLNECLSIFNLIKEGLQLSDIYSNDDYFSKAIKLLYIYKDRLLQSNEIIELFNISRSTVLHRIYDLKLEEYFDITDSQLEIQFKDFLISNNYKEDTDFIRHNYILQTDKDTLQEIDFLCNNIGIEINDIISHNIKYKNSTYHYNKTLMAKDQHNIRLIHLWEWELNETNWYKTSNWILHLLNQNKIRLDLEIDCNNDIRLVDKNEAISFLDRYSLDNERRFNKFIGIYYNNELIELLSFIDRVLSITVKFGYELVKGTDTILQLYIQSLKVPYILTYTDLSKFTGNSLEEIGFKLIQYQDPNIILEDINEVSKYKQLYNCGYNVYQLLLKGEVN